MPLLALEGIRVLEVTDGIAGPYCAKLLADYGAEVVKIERLGADSMTQRQWAGTRVETSLTVEDTALFLHLNTNKKSVALDLECADGQALFRRLVSESSIVVESLSPGRMESFGLGYDALKSLNPSLVMTSVTPYGQTGPYKDYQYTELTAFATGGGLHREGIPERHPLMYGGEIAQYFTGTAAASVTMGASLGALLTGQGDWIDISIMECMAGHPHQIGRRAPFAYAGEMDQRREPRTAGAGGREPYAVGTFRCKDGYVSFLPLGPRMWPNIARMIEKPELMDDPRFGTPDLRVENRIELEAIFQEWLDRHTRAEVFKATNQAGIPGGPLLSPPEVMADKHFQERGFFQEMDHPEFGTLSYPGAPFGLSDVDTTDGRTAPALGEHTVDVLEEVLGMDETDVGPLRQAGVIS
jgi:crotonobetainyl-CoA:carnitine CoA-transferase CaiB-like acyl-CoA transferase